MLIRLVCATRADEGEFFKATALGRSLVHFLPYKGQFDLRVAYKNAESLSVVFNRAIDEAAGQDLIFAFMHDDIHLCDVHWPSRVREAMARFDIAGVVGNRRRVPRQPSWALLLNGDKIEWDQSENLSGAVGHGSGFPPKQIDIYGPSPAQVKLLDGLMLMVKSSTLRETGLRFDERFRFHFYDMDFCRQAEAKDLRLGTWPLSLIHESQGNFGDGGWLEQFGDYLRKWSE